jgi:hypothetical protein
MVLDDLFRPEHLDGLPGRTGSSEEAAQPHIGPLPDSMGQADRAPPSKNENAAPVHEVLRGMSKNPEDTQAEALDIVLLATAFWLGSPLHNRAKVRRPLTFRTD